MRRVSGRLSSMSLLAVTAESKDPALLKRFVDELVPKLRALPPDLLASVEDGPREAQKFFEQNKHLYAGLDELKELHDKILSRYDWEVARATDALLDDEEPQPITAQTVRGTFQKSLDRAKAATPGDGGYYIGEDGHLAVILIRTPLRAMDQRAFELEAHVERLIESGHYRNTDPQFKHGFTGNLVTSAEEYRDITRDLTEVGIAGGILVLLVVYLFFFRVRALLALGFSVALGLVWTLAFTVLTIGYLNTATGFLISVIIGNGINAMVIYMARFLEARRDQGLSMPEALKTALLKRLKLPAADLRDFRIFKRAHDARNKQAIFYIYTLDVTVADEAALLARFARDPDVRPAPDMVYKFVAHAPSDFPSALQTRLEWVLELFFDAPGRAQ